MNPDRVAELVEILAVCVGRIADETARVAVDTVHGARLKASADSAYQLASTVREEMRASANRVSHLEAQIRKLPMEVRE